MRSSLVHLLVLVVVAVAAPAAAAAEPPFEWTMPTRLGADEDGDGMIDYAGSAAEFEAEEARRDGFQVDLGVRRDLCRKSATYSWQFPAGAIVESGGAGCHVSQRFPREGSYPVELEVRFPGGRVENFQREVTVRDWLVVSIGDSVASGEGNPEVGGNGDRARWQSARCHRSAKAGPAQAALGLEAADPETSTTFVHLACSGAQIDEGLLGGFEGVDPDRSAEPRLLLPQVDELEQIARERQVDAVLLSIGANDVHFGPIVRFCLQETNCIERPFQPKEEANPPPNGPRPLTEVVAAALFQLPGEYAALAKRLDSVVSPSHVVVVDYFDPTRDDDGEFCERIGLRLPWRLLRIDRDEARWAATGILEPLNAKIGEAARSAGWTEVTGVADAFRTHGYCADERWIRRIKESFFTQRGNTFFSRFAGALHPNEEGHRQEAELIGRDLDTVLYGDEHTGDGEDEESGDGGEDAVVLVREVGDGGESSGEASLEEAALIGLGGVVVVGLLGAGGYAARRRGKEPAGEGTPLSSGLPARPTRWPDPPSVKAFGALLESSSSWVHRRVESIEIVDDRLVRRRVSVDFTPQVPGDAPRRVQVPIALLAKRILTRFDLRDEGGASVPLATSEQNAAFAAAHMLAIAAEETGEPPSERLQELCWTIARGDPPVAAAAVEAIAGALEPEATREALRKSERFRAATTTFANGFAVIVEVEEPSRRRVMKFAYDHAVKSGLTLRERLGLDPVPFRFFIPEIGDAGSRHMEFVRAEGLEALDVKLVGRLPDGTLFPRRGSGEGGEAHLTVTRMPRGTQAFASVSLRAVRSGILVGGPVLAALSAAALTAAWFALPDLAGDSGGAASILLAVPAALGAYLGSRKPHPLEAATLWGARGLVFLSGMLAFIGAGTLALDSSVEFLRIVIGLVALLSWLPAAGLLVTFLHPRPPPRNDRDTVL